jgi:phosphoglycerate dehydrogenase-like enzyme
LQCNKIADEGVEFLKNQPGLDIDITTGLKETEACEHIRKADAVIVRSATSIRGDIHEAGKNLLSDMVNKLTAGKQLSDYELHIMLDVLLVHKRTGSN